MEEKIEQEKEILVNLEKRASRMFIEGHPPTPRWWLERIVEVIEEVKK